MTDDFRKWLCEITGIETNEYWSELELLIKAMWAINREAEEKRNIYDGYYWIEQGIKAYIVKCNSNIKTFYYEDYNNSEQQTLEKTLEYIYKQERS